MNVILFGASGMIGQGVLRECLLDPEIQRVLLVVRSAVGETNPKVLELVHKDFTDYSGVKDQLEGYDACLFCLGVSASGMSEKDYRHVTYDYTLATAKTLVEINPSMTFIYVSGAGTNSSERGGSMWARVKGETENALLKLPFKAKFMFRPGMIQPLHGIKSRTTMYRVIYTVMAPVFPLARLIAPTMVTNTERLARAMINVATNGFDKTVLEAPDIHRAAGN